MNATAVIDRFAIRWNVRDVPATGAGAFDPARLDALAGRMLEGPLEDALAAVGIARDEEVCLRRVVVPPVTVRWGQADEAVFDALARAIGAAVQAAVASGGSATGGPDVVHYRSLTHARIDLVVRSLTGDRRRVWAWRQLGLWPVGLPVPDEAAEGTAPSLPAEVLLRLLDDEPLLIVPTFVQLAGRGAVGRAAATFGAGALVRLADRAWWAAGGTGRLPTEPAGVAADRPARPGSHEGVGEGTSGPRDHVDPAGRAVAVVRRSRIAAAVAAAPRHGAAVRTAWAVLAVLEAEPSAARGRPIAGLHAGGLVPAVARLLGPATRSPTSPGGAPDRPVVAAGGVAPGPAPSAGVGDSGADRGDEGHVAATAHRVPALTSWAGLLFLVNVLDDLGLPGRLLADDVAATVGSQGALHALGGALLDRCVGPEEAPVSAGDPALLAFCGLPPGAEPPEPIDGGGGELSAVARAAEEVAAEVSRRIGGTDVAPRVGSSGHDRGGPPADANLADVCHRTGRLVPDPGWFDVLLDLDEVSTDVRRAGLDLDPGYVWWLGAVVRFRYV